MQQLIFWLFVSASSISGTPALEPHQVLDEARIALAGGRDLVPDRIEIDAIYRYADSDEEIIDHTVIEPGRRLFQEREIGGRTIRRGWSEQDAFMESPNGRIPLEKEMVEGLETYFCLRQLELFILCPGAEVSKISTTEQGRRILHVTRGGKQIAEVEIDVESHRLMAIRYLESVDPELTDEVTEVRYSEYLDVADGWTLPHQVETRVGGKKKSSYSVKKWTLEMPSPERADVALAASANQP